MKFLNILLVTFILQSCSVYMAANQEDRKDVSVFSKGTDRLYVIGAIGQPTATSTRNGNKVDTFQFTQGYSDGSKVGRVLAHGTMDVLTLGLWEVIGTPIEAVADGQEVTIEVVYDKKDKVDQVKVFQEGKLLSPEKTEAFVSGKSVKENKPSAVDYNKTVK